MGFHVIWVVVKIMVPIRVIWGIMQKKTKTAIMGYMGIMGYIRGGSELKRFEWLFRLLLLIQERDKF